MVIDYQKGKIYKIVNDLNDYVYVGSTVNTLSRRMAHHRDDFVKYPNRKLYKFIRDNGGWDHFKIILIEDYPCDRKEQLLQREQYYKKIATLNNNNCYGIDKKRYKQYQKEYQTEYRKEHNKCMCGKEYTNDHKSRHEKSKHHQDYIIKQQQKKCHSIVYINDN